MQKVVKILKESNNMKRTREAIIKGLGKIKFELLENNLEVGDYINHEEVTDIKELRIGGFLRSNDDEYKYYIYHTTFNQEPDDDPEDKYYCIYVGLEDEECDDDEIKKGDL